MILLKQKKKTLQEVIIHTEYRNYCSDETYNCILNNRPDS